VGAVYSDSVGEFLCWFLRYVLQELACVFSITILVNTTKYPSSSVKCHAGRPILKVLPDDAQEQSPDPRTADDMNSPYLL
jgi:hypothetical protein